MARLLYKPFGIVAGIIAGRLAASLFETIWGRLDRSSPKGHVPDPTERNAPVARAITATAVEAATYAGTKAAVDRAGVKVFHHLTGIWAGAKSPEENAEVASTNGHPR